MPTEKPKLTLKQKFSNFFYETIGGWAYYVGSVMADGFEDRMIEMAAEEEKQVQEDLKLAVKRIDRKVN